MRAVKYCWLLALLVAMGCGGPSQLSFEEAEGYLMNAMTTAAVHHMANGYEVEVKQLPSQYLALREVKAFGDITQTAYDSALESYGEARYFLLTIKPQEGVREGDIMMQGVSNYEEYQERFIDLSFSLKDYLSLEYEGGELPPVLATTEHGYGLSAHRSAMLAFAPGTPEEASALTNGPVTVVFDDRIFQTGISRFPFNSSSLTDLPAVQVNTPQ